MAARLSNPNRGSSGQRPLRNRTVLLALASLGVVPYLSALRYPFVYDDHWTIETNRSLDGAFWGLVSRLLDGSAYSLDIPDATRPAMVLLTWLERRVHGGDVVLHHALSLLIYAATVAAAWWLSWALLRRRRAASWAAAVFALAPLHAESVVAINYREDLLAGLGVMVCLGCLLMPSRDRHSWRRAGALATIWAIALLSKESGVALLPLLALCLLFQTPDPRRWLLRRERSLFALGAVLLVWASWRGAMALSGDPLPTTGLTVLERWLATPSYFGWALGRALVPLGGVPVVDPRTEWAVGASDVLGLLALVGCVVLASLRRTRRLGLALLLILGAALPSSPLAGPYNDRADRYVFVSILFGAHVWIELIAHLRAALRRPWPSMRVQGTVAAGLVLALGVLCHLEARVWSSDRAIWSTAVRRAPESVRAWTGLAYVERTSGRTENASRAIDRALALRPDFARARLGRIYVRVERGELVAARRELEQLRPDSQRLAGFARADVCLARPNAEVSACMRGQDESSETE